MYKFDDEILKWSTNPIQSPSKLISSFRSNRFKYINDFDETDKPIEFCKKVFLPNHLAWFLEQENFKKQLAIARKSNDSKTFLKNLIKSTISLYYIEEEIKHLLEQNIVSDFALNKRLIKKSINLLEKANKYEILRVSYNSQIRSYIEKELSRNELSTEDLNTILTPTFGTIYTFFAEEYLENGKDISLIGKNYFANSIKDAEIKLPNWIELADQALIKKRNNSLTAIKLKKKRLYRQKPELLWIDGLITFDNLIDKLIVYSGLLRHDTFLKLALFKRTGLKPEEIFKTKIYSPKEKLSSH